jgi:hypothetical protein
VAAAGKQDLEIRVHSHSAPAGALEAALWGEWRLGRMAESGETESAPTAPTSST